MRLATFDYESRLMRHYHRIVGLDEVGRGAWAGPIVSVAYRFFTVPADLAIGDSKILTERKRLDAVRVLQSLGEWGIGEVSNREIDELGLQQAQTVSYQRAIDGLSSRPDIVLLDGRPVDLPEFTVEAIVDGDATIASIAAASIIAKVYRDSYMKTHAHRESPSYRFDRHVGYGTRLHLEAVNRFGISRFHRRSFRPMSAMLQSRHGE